MDSDITTNNAASGNDDLLYNAVVATLIAASATWTYVGVREAPILITQFNRGFRVPKQPSTTSSAYSREDIERYANNHIRFAKADNLPPEQQQRLRNLYISVIEQLPPWRQVTVIEGGRDVVLGKDSRVVRAAAGGLFEPGTNKIYARHFGIENADLNPEYDNYFARVINHEEGHRNDYNLNRLGYWSDHNPRWKAALDKEIARYEETQGWSKVISNLTVDPEHKRIYEHLKAVRQSNGKPYYKRSEFPKEALAEFEAIFNKVYVTREGDWRAIDTFMEHGYPDLWPVYRDEFIPELQRAARRMNPNIALEPGLSAKLVVAPPTAPVFSIERAPGTTASEWSHYKSSLHGQTMRYDTPFDVSKSSGDITLDMKRFENQMRANRIDIKWGRNGDKAYAYILASDTASMASYNRMVAPYTGVRLEQTPQTNMDQTKQRRWERQRAALSPALPLPEAPAVRLSADGSATGQVNAMLGSGGYSGEVARGETMSVHIETTEPTDKWSPRVTRIEGANETALSGTINSVQMETLHGQTSATISIAGDSEAVLSRNLKAVRSLLEAQGYTNVKPRALGSSASVTIENMREGDLSQLMQRLSSPVELGRGETILAAIEPRTANDVIRADLAQRGVKPSEAGLVGLVTEDINGTALTTSNLPGGSIASVREDGIGTTRLMMRDGHRANEIANTLRTQGMTARVMRGPNELNFTDGAEATAAAERLEQAGMPTRRIPVTSLRLTLGAEADPDAALAVLKKANITAHYEAPQVHVVVEASADRVAETLSRSGDLPNYVADEIAGHVRAARPAPVVEPMPMQQQQPRVEGYTSMAQQQQQQFMAPRTAEAEEARRAQMARVQLRQLQQGMTQEGVTAAGREGLLRQVNTLANSNPQAEAALAEFGFVRDENGALSFSQPSPSAARDPAVGRLYPQDPDSVAARAASEDAYHNATTPEERLAILDERSGSAAWRITTPPGEGFQLPARTPEEKKLVSQMEMVRRNSAATPAVADAAGSVPMQQQAPRDAGFTPMAQQQQHQSMATAEDPAVRREQLARVQLGQMRTSMLQEGMTDYARGRTLELVKQIVGNKPNANSLLEEYGFARAEDGTISFVGQAKPPAATPAALQNEIETRMRAASTAAQPETYPGLFRGDGVPPEDVQRGLDRNGKPIPPVSGHSTGADHDIAVVRDNLAAGGPENWGTRPQSMRTAETLSVERLQAFSPLAMDAQLARGTASIPAERLPALRPTMELTINNMLRELSPNGLGTHISEDTAIKLLDRLVAQRVTATRYGDKATEATMTLYAQATADSLREMGVDAQRIEHALEGPSVVDTRAYAPEERGNIRSAVPGEPVIPHDTSPRAWTGRGATPVTIYNPDGRARVSASLGTVAQDGVAPGQIEAVVGHGEGLTTPTEGNLALKPQPVEVPKPDSAAKFMPKPDPAIRPASANDHGAAVRPQTQARVAPSAPANDVADAVRGASTSLQEAEKAAAATRDAARVVGGVSGEMLALHEYEALGQAGRMSKLLSRGAQKIPLAGAALAGGFAAYLLYKDEQAYAQGKLNDDQIGAVRKLIGPYALGQAGSLLVGTASEEVIEAALKAAGVPEEYRPGTLRTAIMNGVEGHLAAERMNAAKAELPQPTVADFIAGMKDKHGTTQDPALNDYLQARDKALGEATGVATWEPKLVAYQSVQRKRQVPSTMRRAPIWRWVARWKPRAWRSRKTRRWPALSR